MWREGRRSDLTGRIPKTKRTKGKKKEGENGGEIKDSLLQTMVRIVSKQVIVMRIGSAKYESRSATWEWFIEPSADCTTFQTTNSVLME